MYTVHDFSTGKGYSERCISTEGNFARGDGVTVYSDEEDKIRFIVRYMYTDRQWHLTSPTASEFTDIWMDCFIRRNSKYRVRASPPKVGEIYQLHLTEGVIESHYAFGYDLPPEKITVTIERIIDKRYNDNFLFLHVKVLGSTVGRNLLTKKVNVRDHFKQKSIKRNYDELIGSVEEGSLEYAIHAIDYNATTDSDETSDFSVFGLAE